MRNAPVPTSPPAPVELKVTSDPANLAAVRRAVEAFAAGHGFGPSAVAEVGLCVNEAMANVIRHAYRGRHDRPLHVAARMDGRTLVVTLRDWGAGVDPTGLPQRPRDPLRPGGVGMVCLRQWMDDIRFAPQPDGGVLTTMTRKRKD